VKRTPLKRGNSQLARTPMSRGSKPIPARSKKTAKIYKEERIPFVKRILSERETCERCQSNPATEVHEILTRGRSGGVKGTAWLEDENVAALCWECHRIVTLDTDTAEDDGWVKRSSN